MFSLADKVALVTGGRRGIGRAVALTFAEAGADVVVSDVVAGEELNGVVAEIKALGRRSLAIQADTTAQADVDSMVKKVVDEFGGIDILVNCAGIFKRSPLIDLPEEDWDLLIDVNLKSDYLCCKAVGKVMVAQKRGNIVNIASRNAIKAEEGRSAYSIAKLGVIMLTRILARELGPNNIRVNSISPGFTKTEMSRPMWSDPKFLEGVISSVPLHRMAEPTEMATVALFLASNGSSYITGQNILVDGGREA